MLTMGNEYEQSETQLEQALALNKLFIDMLEKERQDRKRTRRVSIICTSICVVCMLIFAGVLAALSAGVVVETTTTETTITQDTGEGDGNNVYQAGEYATYSETGGNE